MLHLKIDRVMHTDHRLQRSLAVVRRVDARAHESALLPSNAFVEQTLGGLLRRHGELKLAVSSDKNADAKLHFVFSFFLASIRRSGYAIGEQIEILIGVDARKSERDVERLSAALIQVVTCRGARNGTKIDATAAKDECLREKVFYKSLVSVDERVRIYRGQLERHILRLSVPTVAQPSIADCVPLALGYQIEASRLPRLRP